MPALLTPVSGPSEAIATAADLRQQLAITSTRDDALLSALISAAESALDGPRGALGRCMVTQVWQARFAGLDGGELRLGLPDVQSVAVRYHNAAGGETVIDPAAYFLIEDDSGAVVLFLSSQTPADLGDHPQPYAVTVTAGFGDASDVPSALKHAVLMMAASYYEHREGLKDGGGEIPFGVDQLIAPYRVWA